MSKVAIITGAASGIGLALTRNLLSLGWRVLMTDISTTTGQTLASELNTSDNCVFIACDVSSWPQQAGVFKAAWEKWGRIDFVAANAGIDDKDDLYGPTEDADGEPRQPNLKTIDVNLVACIYATRLAVHYFRRNEVKGGKLVFTSSDAGIYPLDGVPMYTATKHGLVGMTRALGSKGGILAKENIFVNAILPAFVPTGLAPPGLVEAWPKENITPMSTVIKAFMMFINDDLTGETGECSLDTVYLRKQCEYANESQRWGKEGSKDVWGKVYPTVSHGRSRHSNM